MGQRIPEKTSKPDSNRPNKKTGYKFTKKEKVQRQIVQ